MDVVPPPPLLTLAVFPQIVANRLQSPPALRLFPSRSFPPRVSPLPMPDCSPRKSSRSCFRRFHRVALKHCLPSSEKVCDVSGLATFCRRSQVVHRRNHTGQPLRDQRFRDSVRTDSFRLNHRIASVRLSVERRRRKRRALAEINPVACPAVVAREVESSRTFKERIKITRLICSSYRAVKHRKLIPLARDRVD